MGWMFTFAHNVEHLQQLLTQRHVQNFVGGVCVDKPSHEASLEKQT
jgi:hypothetical protein